MRDPYEAVRDLCADLVAEGVSPDLICDALLQTGLQAGARLEGREHVIAYLHKMIAVFEAQAESRTAPPLVTQ